MFEIFESAGSELGYSGLVQLSMYGPNVNQRVFEMVQTSVQTQTSKKLLNVGSLGCMYYIISSEMVLLLHIGT